MKLENFKQAKLIRETIDHMKVKKLQLEKMEKRDNDEDFNLARELAHDAICYSISRMEGDFNAI